MKRLPFLLLFLLPSILFAQKKEKQPLYPSLLWEITGKGLNKPSYLFGTMHVSNKLAFQLSDSFYLGIRNADIVALETNPESWQEDMSLYGNVNSENYNGRNSGNFVSMPEDFLTINTLKFYKYDKKIERSLYSSPSTINNLLYRNYDRANSDFEEDTYLDMYIYQCGKRWGKKVAGVEGYAESMKLMAEAYRDAAKDKNRNRRSYDIDAEYSVDKLQEAYRTGNLDLLDSIHKLNSFSEAFDEKFLYKRNEIQAESIDSILKSKSSLFVGVGAAHLPGERGVIEMLRNMGYKLRPIKMGKRDSQHKNAVEKIRVPVSFITQTADDSLFQVDIPGKFYKFGEDGSLDQRQYADMANGSYYMVTRVMTNAWMWGHTMDDVYRTVDSLLYENIPGKIITKTGIQKNGFKGIAITNKTRRGDIQRYNIFITPFEIIFFKMSGTGEYVKNGSEADRFFNSIKFRNYRTEPLLTPGARKYSPPYGGFAVSFPHQPYIGNDGSWIFDAEDRSNNTRYRIVRSDVHNYDFAGEDSFDLNLMEESFAASEFIGKQISRKHTRYKGYPALDCKFTDSRGYLYQVRFIIRGPHYYTILAHGRQENDRMRAFLDSFEFIPYEYGEVKTRKDSVLYYSVKSPVFFEEKEKLEIPQQSFNSEESDEEPEMEAIRSGIFRSRIISNDSTGERIFVSFFSARRYFHTPDSGWLDKIMEPAGFGDSTRVLRSLQISTLPNGMKVWDRVVSDSGSSRAHRMKTFYHNGTGYRLVTQIDTLSKPSAFIQHFFDSFAPVDTIAGSNPFVAKSQQFIDDFMSTDSVRHKRAVQKMYEVRFDSTQLTNLARAIASLNWKEKKYLDTKNALISKLYEIKTAPSSDLLAKLFYAAGDTVELQYTALETLLRQKTSYSFKKFRDIVIDEPPVLGIKGNNTRYQNNNYNSNARITSYSNGHFLDDLFDSLALTKEILTDILPLINLDDYEKPLMALLGTMVDSNLVKPGDYNAYLSKFLIEAKQEVKKQRIAEKNIEIRKAEMEKESDGDVYNQGQKDAGNDELSLYAKLLLPHSSANPTIEPLINQMLASTDKELRYSTMMLLLRNKKQVADSILYNFAKDDDYRYDFYSDMKSSGLLKKFPAEFHNQVDIGRSRLLSSKIYGRPDSLVFITKIPASLKGRAGVVHFYKYKNKKDDLSWKIATVGLLPADSSIMEFEDVTITNYNEAPFAYGRRVNYDFHLVEFTEGKLGDEASLDSQLSKLLKKMLYSKRKSAQEFYEENQNSRYDYFDAVRSMTNRPVPLESMQSAF